ncbi:MAG: LysR family transcriptional regulator, partial [Alphaproteobacteria bacterium]
MAVSLDQLQAFVAAAEAGSFSGAARALRKAQSAVSTQVSNLEADLGVTLFNRAGRNPVLTPAGERLLLEARVVLERCEHLVGVARSLEQRVENRLVVAIDELYP